MTSDLPLTFPIDFDASGIHHHVQSTINAKLVVVRFKNRSTQPTDFNDLHRLESADAVAKQIIEVAESQRSGGITSPDPLRRQGSLPESYPLDALGGMLAATAKGLQEVIKAPDAICGQSVLAAAALAVQGHVNVMIDGRRHPVSLFAVTVGLTGERKSTVDPAVLLPHREHEKALYDQYVREQAEYTDRHDLWKKARETALAGKKSLQQRRDELSIIS